MRKLYNCLLQDWVMVKDTDGDELVSFYYDGGLCFEKVCYFWRKKFDEPTEKQLSFQRKILDNTANGIPRISMKKFWNRSFQSPPIKENRIQDIVQSLKKVCTNCNWYKRETFHV